MDFEIRKYVGNGDDPKLQLLYNAINQLVNVVGDVTIAELFQHSCQKMGPDKWKAIQAAKRFGFLAVRNNSCCGGGDCKPSKAGWCSKTSTGECSAASDSCGTESEGLMTFREGAMTARELEKTR